MERLRWLLYLGLTAAAVFVAQYHVLGSIHALFLSLRYDSEQQYTAGLFFAPRFFDRLNDDSLDYLEKLAERPAPRTSTSNSVCPIILSPLARLDPHYLWLVTSIFRGGNDEVQTVHFLTRRADTEGHERFPFSRQLIKKLEASGHVTHQVLRHAVSMPSREALLHKLTDATVQQTEHFILQLYDHAEAWNTCHTKKCGYCLVLEDDVLLSRNWMTRLKAAIEIVEKKDPQWGYLKLFEIDDHWKQPSGWKFTAADFSFLLILSSIIATAMFFTFEFFRLSSQKGAGARWHTVFCRIFVWAAFLLFLVGKDILVVPYVLSAVTRWHEPTSVRPSKWPERGAVANVYRVSDLLNLAQSARDTVELSMKYSVQYYGQNLTALPEEERIYIERTRHSDRIRADVFASEYFRSRGRSISIVEPNLVQHIGFRSTEPSVIRIRTAMTNTFEDGRLF